MHKSKRIKIFAVTIMLISSWMLSWSTASAATLLKRSMEGAEVVALQQVLKDMGYLEANATGFFGAQTEAALKAFQRDKGLMVDGIAGSEVFNIINKVDNASVLAKVKNIPEDKVNEIQKLLYELGYLAVRPTGYYGELTIDAVRKFQSRYGLLVDGIAGNTTVTALRKAKTTRGSNSQSSYIYSWANAQKIFTLNSVATVYDIKTGISFKVKRTYGSSHADCEPVSAADTAKMKQIYGGWSWNRRAIIVTVNGTVMAASMNGMPHAGLDSKPAEAWVSGRSGDFGSGTNLDRIKGNDMNGVFCIHFQGSKTHGSNRVDPQHQSQINNAAAWATKNY